MVSINHEVHEILPAKHRCRKKFWRCDMVMGTANSLLATL